MTTATAFETFVRPALMEKLRAIGLDVEYHRAKGDFLYYREPDGREVEVLDLVGGFGAGLLGHNHPDMVARARAVLDAERPFHAQASKRETAGRLGARLSARLERSTGVDYIATFANSGTEAVEAAIKHAEMERVGRRDRILELLRERGHLVRSRLRNQTAHLPPALFAEAEERFDLPPVETFEALFLALSRFTMTALERPPVFWAVRGAFHGKTSGALKLTYNAEFRGPWRDLGLRGVFLPNGDLQAIRQQLEVARISYPELMIDQDGAVSLARREVSNVAACLVEPIQGEGGIREVSADYLRALRLAADEGGFPLVIDEIQSGMGRTGTFLASEPTGVRGDYYLLSKSLGGGLAKIAALLVARERYLPEFGYIHTSTYADDDFSSSLALQALDLIERDDDALIHACRARGDYLMARLHDLQTRYPDQLEEVRGRGLMVGVELASQADSPSPLVRVLGDQGLLAFLISGHLLHEERIRVAPTLSSHGTIRVQPSGYISEASLDRFCEALDRVLQILRDADVLRLARFVVREVGEVIAPPASPVVRKAPAVRRNGHHPTRVGFLSHFLAPRDFTIWEPGLGPFSDAHCERFFEQTRHVLEPFVAAERELRSAQGRSVAVTVIGLPFTPAQVLESLRAGSADVELALIRRGVERARGLGCSVVGFGGYTSIITDNCRAIVESDLALTSGNSLTAAAALDALFQEASRLELGTRRLGVVGAAGNIGQVLAQVAAEQVDELVLIGRDRAGPRLRAAASRLVQAGVTVPIRVAPDLNALRDCNLILSTTNSARPVIRPEHLSDDPVIISDIAVPRDVDPSVLRERPRAVVLKGGIVKAPLGQRLDIEGMRLGEGEVYGCLAETILLGLAGFKEHFSYGSLLPERVKQIGELARFHGFQIEAHPLGMEPRSDD